MSKIILFAVLLGGCVKPPSETGIKIRIASQSDNTDTFAGMYEQDRDLRGRYYSARLTFTQAEQLDILRVADSIDFWDYPTNFPSNEFLYPEDGTTMSDMEPSPETDTIRIKKNSGGDHQIIFNGLRAWQLKDTNPAQRKGRIISELENIEKLQRLISMVRDYARNKPEVKQLPPRAVRL
jgi:hypothetical protein